MSNHAFPLRSELSFEQLSFFSVVDESRLLSRLVLSLTTSIDNSVDPDQTDLVHSACLQVQINVLLKRK